MLREHLQKTYEINYQWDPHIDSKNRTYIFVGYKPIPYQPYRPSLEKNELVK